ncbi:glycosyl hydrolase family 85 [Nitrospirillum viridazoti]|uniref:Glycosyl hydrolase family 85 n=2 Tax=Nitrospirillum TaxID=1543705 RepID=A0A560IBS8_9PROT|nr:glycosyl hydrolase family 85 [Nitrospirillum amazonense]
MGDILAGPLPGSSGLTRRGFASLALAALAAGTVPVPLSAARAGGEAAGGGRLLPRYPLAPAGSGWDAFQALMDYDPRDDADAPYFQSRVRRARRIAPFAATQAHPALDPVPGVASLSDCYGPLAAGIPEETLMRRRHGTSLPGGVQVPRIFTYHDIIVGWRGTGMIPNPALVDVAHRNGALALGTIFQPDHRLYDGSAVPMPEVARRMVDLADYFGFDGYFVNFENGTEEAEAQVLDWIAAMRDEAKRRGLADFHIQFYDGGTDMNWLMRRRDGRPGQAFPDSAMLDQGWSRYGGPGNCCSGAPVAPLEVRGYCLANGFDPRGVAYFGLQLYPGPGYLGAAAPQVIHPNDGAYAYGGLQVYSVEDGLRTLLRSVRTSLLAPGEGAGATADRRILGTLERMFFSGQSQNPAHENAPDAAQAQAYLPGPRGRHRYTDHDPAAPKPTDQLNLPMTYGVANFIAERSVIGAFPFLTRFNTGDGDRFHVGGAVVADRPWFNLGIQDILPTWQWRVEPMAGPASRGADLLAVDYAYDTAFDGGSSLAITGSLGPANATRVWLYKTALAVDGVPGCVAQLVLKGQGGGALRLGLVFVDAPAKPAWLPLDGAHRQALPGGWSRLTLPLAPYRGRTIAAVLLGAASAAAAPLPVDIRIGELYVGPPPAGVTMPAPRGLTVEACAASVDGRWAEARLRWAPEPAAAYHDVYAAAEGAAGDDWIWQGRVTGTAYHVTGAPIGTDGQVRLRLRAASHGPQALPGAPAEVIVMAS